MTTSAHKLHTHQALTSSALVMAPEDVYNVVEIGLLYHVRPNKTLAQGKVHGFMGPMQKDRLTLALVVNTTCSDKLKNVIIYKFLHPICSRRWFPTYYVWWLANQMAWMTSNVFKGLMMSLDVHFISQKGTFNYATHFF
jgi:hypothetical protein